MENQQDKEIAYCKELNISFTNLCYNVKNLFDKVDKKILKSLNGEFRSGELSVIMGTSGSGKSTLLDVLSGYTRKNVTGEIRINGGIRNQKLFRHQCSYIMQDHTLHSLLTVEESMKFSINLKIGTEMSQVQKDNRIHEILQTLRLTESLNTFTGHLSGGQKKRLAIALELVDNPKVMFFDEPTSGLDSSSASNCITLLKQLSFSGRTIICTIHQPSALLFEMFDHLYTISAGQCIYQGSSANVVPYLHELELICPSNHNPADYLLEISTNDYGLQNEKLCNKIENGMNLEYRNSRASMSKSPSDELLPLKFDEMEASGSGGKRMSPSFPVLIDPKSYCDADLYGTSFFRQFYQLLIRTFLLLTRDKSMTAMRIIIHSIVAPMIGIMYFGIGNQAENIFNNFKYIFFSIMFLMFTAFSSMQTRFPLEISVIKREHFNRWYSVRAYYAALSLADIPTQFICTLIYVLITYFLTNQPLEFSRFWMFFLICLLVCFVAQGLGLLCGSIFDVTNGAVFGTFFICPFLIFSGFFVKFSDVHNMLHWLFHISFLKYALEGAVQSLFGYDREKFVCSEKEVYCHFRIPKKFMKFIDMENGNYTEIVIGLISFILFFRLIAFAIMRYRLKH